MSVLDFYSEDIVAGEEPEILETSNPICFDESSYSSEIIHPCVSSGTTAYTPDQENLSELERRLQFTQSERYDGSRPIIPDECTLIVDEFLYKLRERVTSSKFESDLEDWTLIIETLKEKSRSLRNAYETKHNRLPEDEPELNLNVDSETTSRIFLLLEKVQMLEKLTGIVSRPIENGSIQLQLNVLNQKIEALMSYMSQQSKNVSSKVTTDSLFSIERDSSLLQKIEYLYERYASLRISNLERVNAQLKSIGLVANSIAPSCDFLNNLGNELNTMQRQITNWESKLSDLEEYMAESRKINWENQSQVDIWIKKLEKELHK
ncbi:hypothetical protein KL930_003731 [Ogataea haglerorum]|uniref:Uncharacterized protein n=1 Tax=Ogataea haglerorum TaxID=1937702 RepID=A0AAN6D4K2_9ASCO|nr:uncharacterized protein KL911_003870 [Ogataea haglerorum]KAG7694412.1 hypothetical protein KL915_003379 [Ogataea haglerorum]KAG7705251.1 hypothetical protein KL914_003937 [Ogataea haglerorum]KAG7705508.1 hypothetical protein KL950_003944 [Ogataea haglerorum]KAG7716621.1 hypothetical protein KL913_003137 [Ogataea haglerorum]KAG7717625.1 hypothetical protein KL949_003459 [Ogataea haglerorum]